jgi:transcriptional regulator with XRE-family HTH domain
VILIAIFSFLTPPLTPECSKGRALFDYEHRLLHMSNTICKIQTGGMMPETTVDISALYAAVDRKRQARGLSWRGLAAELKITPSTFTRMAQGMKPDVDTFATLVQWLGIPQKEFLRPSPTRNEDADPVAMISSYLRASKNLTHEQANALEDIMNAAFRHLTKQSK